MSYVPPHYPILPPMEEAPARASALPTGFQKLQHLFVEILPSTFASKGRIRRQLTLRFHEALKEITCCFFQANPKHGKMWKNDY